MLDFVFAVAIPFLCCLAVFFILYKTLLTKEQKLSIRDDLSCFTPKAILNSSRQFLNKIIESLKAVIHDIVENPAEFRALLMILFVGGSFWFILAASGYTLTRFSTVIVTLVVAIFVTLLTELFTFKVICLITFIIVAWRIYKKLSEIAQALKKLE